MNANSAIVNHFTSELRRLESESTVHTIKKRYIQASKEAKADVKILSHDNCGHLLKLGDFDASVQTYTPKLQIGGKIANCTIAIVAAKGIMKSHDPSLLKFSDLSLSWARSLQERMNFFCP